MAKTFILHDESVNSQGYWMMTSGCDLKQFEKNPIMLWNHNYAWGDTRESKLPIGHWENVRIKGKQILADAVFDNDDFSQTIAKKVENSTLRMASVGVDPIETSTDAKYIKRGQRYETILKWQLREASIVNIGANDNAMALSHAVIYGEKENILELSNAGSSPLKELNLNKKIMDVNLLTELQLSADATPAEISAAVQSVLAGSKELQADNESLTVDRDNLQAELDAIALADKENKTKDFELKLAAAFKDGRLDADKEGNTKASWLKMHDDSPENASNMLDALPKHSSASKTLNDGNALSGNAFEVREKEINEKKNKK